MDNNSTAFIHLEYIKTTASPIVFCNNFGSICYSLIVYLSSASPFDGEVLDDSFISWVTGLYKVGGVFRGIPSSFLFVESDFHPPNITANMRPLLISHSDNLESSVVSLTNQSYNESSS